MNALLASCRVFRRIRLLDWGAGGGGACGWGVAWGDVRLGVETFRRFGFG